MARRGGPTALAGPLRGGPSRVEAIRRGHRQQADVAPILRHQAGRRDRFRRDRTRVGHHGLRVRTGASEPVAARDDVGRVFAGDGAPRLLDRPRRQSKVNRTTVVLGRPHVGGGLVLGVVAGPLDVLERPPQDRGELVDEGGLEAGEPVLRETDQRGRDRLVCATLRRQRHARRGRGQDEAGVLVAGVVQGIQTALDERDRRACRWGSAARRTANATGRAPTA